MVQEQHYGGEALPAVHNRGTRLPTYTEEARLPKICEGEALPAVQKNRHLLPAMRKSGTCLPAVQKRGTRLPAAAHGFLPRLRASALLSLLLALCLLLSGCSRVRTSVTGQGNGYAAGDADTSHGDGSPWIDSDLPENLRWNMPTDPREDFHLYACLDYLTDGYIPDGFDTWSRYMDCSVEVNIRCLELLKDLFMVGHDGELIQTLYRLATDWKARNKDGVEPVRELADRILQLDSLDALTALLEEDDVKYILYDYINLSVAPGISNSGVHVVYVTPGGLFLGDAAEYAERTELGELDYQSLRDQFVYLAGRLGMGKEEALSRLESAMDLERELASACMTYEEMMSSDYVQRANNVMTFQEASALCSRYPLGDMLETQGARYGGSYVVTEPEYLRKLDTLYTEEHLDALVNNVYVDFLLNASDYLDRDAYAACEAIDNGYKGIEGQCSDEEMGLGVVMRCLPTAMQRSYVKAYGSQKARDDVETICRDVLSTYREILMENDWLSEETRKRAVGKLDTMEIHVGWPDVWADLEGLSIENLSYYDALNVINRYYIDLTLARIGTSVDARDWAADEDILQTNSFYDQSTNSINMLLGMMGEPFYYEGMTTEELYASIAAMWVGHEISHAFDSIGAQYDADGNLNNWWTERDWAEFRRRVEKLDACLDRIVPFSGYTVNGENVETEMLADMTGLQCALRMAQKVENFDYARFFVHYAELNATLRLYSAELSMLLRDEHPLDYLRTNVAVQQFEEFHTAFDVRPGDRMYLAPENRVLVW